MLFPMVPLRKDRYKYEAYKEYSPPPALSPPKGRKPWVRRANDERPGRAKEKSQSKFRMDD